MAQTSSYVTARDQSKVVLKIRAQELWVGQAAVSYNKSIIVS